VQEPRDVGFEDAALRLGIGGRGSHVGHWLASVPGCWTRMEMAGNA
jgi:hypothetical protein